MKKILEIKNVTDWEEYKTNIPDITETIIFKYSPVCGTSQFVEGVFNDWFIKLSETININCLKIDVINARPLSKKIANDLGVMHQSPQIIWLSKEGKVKWSDSHYFITEDKLNENLNT